MLLNGLNFFPSNYSGSARVPRGESMAGLWSDPYRLGIIGNNLLSGAEEVSVQHQRLCGRCPPPAGLGTQAGRRFHQASQHERLI